MFASVSVILKLRIWLAQLASLDPLPLLPCMGYLNLSGLGIQFQHLLSLRPMFIIELELRDNPSLLVPGLSLSQNRLVLVHLFPRVWVLDGVFITLEERAEAATFMENADATLIDATRSGLSALPDNYSYSWC